MKAGVVVFLLILEALTINRSPIVAQNRTIVDQNRTIKWCKKLKTLEGGITEADNVALVSFPGSGSSWLRYLLQQVTGMHTGSVDNEGHLNRTALQEQVNAALSAKHSAQLQMFRRNLHNYTKCILLIRYPSDTILMLYHYAHRRNTGLPPREEFQGAAWHDFVLRMGMEWLLFYSTALGWTGGPIHVVFYESLVKHTRKTLKKVLQFLGRNHTEEEVRCAVDPQNSPFIEKKWHMRHRPFTHSMRELLTKYATEVLKEVKAYQTKHGNHYAFGL